MDLDAMQEYFTQRERSVQGAVGEWAILLPLVEHQGELCLLFETRAETLIGHQPGEVCFPGGRREQGETPAQTACRETFEELGIPQEEIRVLAPLDVIQDISDRVIYPFLGSITPKGLEALCPSPGEVKDAFFVPLAYLRSCPEEVYRYRIVPEVDGSFPFQRMGFPADYPWRQGWMDVPIYEYEGHFIWGLTARTVRWLLRELDKMEGRGA